MKSLRSLMILASSAVIAGAIGASSASAESVAEFYKGKSIDLLIGFGPGGGYDTYSRLLARHYSRHIPGNPRVIPQNMPGGGGGLRVANTLYNVSARDGTKIGVFAASTTFEPLFGGKSTKFEATKFTWIGNMNQDTASCGVWKTSGVKTWKDMKKKQIIFGSTGPQAITSQHALVMRNLLGAKVKVIMGYKGTKGVNLAMRRGEVSGSCGLFESSVKSRWIRDIQSGDLRIIVQFGKTRKKVPIFGDAVNIYDLIKDPLDIKVAEVIFEQSKFGRPVAGPPNIPKDRTAALRKGFMDTMKDPKFLADAKRIRLAINPQGAKDIHAFIDKYYAYPKDIVDRAKKMMGR